MNDDSDMDMQIYKTVDQFQEDAVSGSDSDLEVDKQIAQEIIKNPEVFLKNLIPNEIRKEVTLEKLRDPEVQKAISKQLDDISTKINDFLGLKGDVKSITDLNPYVKLHDFLRENFWQFIQDGHLRIELHIRYFMCTYILLFLPTEFIIAMPKLFIKLLPDKIDEFPFIEDVMKELHIFLDFVKEASKSRFLITFTFGRKNTVEEDIEFIMSIPFLLLKNFPLLVSNLLEFEIQAKGYDEYKKRL